MHINKYEFPLEGNPDMELRGSEKGDLFLTMSGAILEYDSDYKSFSYSIYPFQHRLKLVQTYGGHRFDREYVFFATNRGLGDSYKGKKRLPRRNCMDIIKKLPRDLDLDSVTYEIPKRK